ncbi:MAG TPA: hypothetical protein VLL77_11945 [Anaerolineales bacterium]|nr:hypothetical protein [Anaerolineales bacterium]
MNSLSKRDLETHISVVGWLQILNSAINLLVAAFIVVLLVGIGSITNDPTVNAILPTTGWVTGGFLAALALPGLIAGIGLLNRSSWSRVMAIVIAIFQLALFPIGTVLGVYTLFVLIQRSAEEAFGCCVSEAPRVQAAAA